jgi:hypothetical protein
MFLARTLQLYQAESAELHDVVKPSVKMPPAAKTRQKVAVLSAAWKQPKQIVLKAQVRQLRRRTSPESCNFAMGEATMSMIEQEIKTLAEKIWPNMHIEVGPNKSTTKVGGVSPDDSGYAVHVHDGNEEVDKVMAGTLERLLEAIELKLNRG